MYGYNERLGREGKRETKRFGCSRGIKGRREKQERREAGKREGSEKKRRAETKQGRKGKTHQREHFCELIYCPTPHPPRPHPTVGGSLSPYHHCQIPSMANEPASLPTATIAHHHLHCQSQPSAFHLSNGCPRQFFLLKNTCLRGQRRPLSSKTTTQQNK
jgi:hypothetical protein